MFFLVLFSLSFWGSLGGLFSGLGSILVSFWSPFCHFWMTFGRLVRFMIIDAPLKRNHTFWGSGGSQLGAFSLFLEVSILGVFFSYFLWIWSSSGCPLAPKTSSFGSLWAPNWRELGSLFRFGFKGRPRALQRLTFGVIFDAFWIDFGSNFEVFLQDFWDIP